MLENKQALLNYVSSDKFLVHNQGPAYVLLASKKENIIWHSLRCNLARSFYIIHCVKDKTVTKIIIQPTLHSTAAIYVVQYDVIYNLHTEKS